MKRIISLLLAAMLVLSLAACGAGAAVPAQSAEPAAEIAAETPAPAPAEPSAEVVQPAVPAADVPAVSDIDLQLNLLYSQISGLKQDASRNTWYYSVTDLDHDGNLELVAASLHPLDRSTNLAIWEVSADRVGLSAVQVVKDEDESFPDIMTDAADCYHDASSDTWSYVFYDNLVISDYEVYTVKTTKKPLYKTPSPRLSAMISMYALASPASTLLLLDTTITSGAPLKKKLSEISTRFRKGTNPEPNF